MPFCFNLYKDNPDAAPCQKLWMYQEITLLLHSHHQKICRFNRLALYNQIFAVLNLIILKKSIRFDINSAVSSEKSIKCGRLD